MTVTTKQSAYDGIGNNPRYMYTVSREAVQEKRRNWREIYGVDDDGKIAHIGSISRVPAGLRLVG